MKKQQKDKQITITPTEEHIYLRLSDKRQRERNPNHIQEVVMRWLERSATRKGRYINEPSIRLETDRDPTRRLTFLLAYAYSFPNTLPDWLRTANPIGKEKIEIEVEE